MMFSLLFNKVIIFLYFLFLIFIVLRGLKYKKINKLSWAIILLGAFIGLILFLIEILLELGVLPFN